MESSDPTPEPIDRDTMPFVAPCRQLAPFAPLRWVRLGIRDLGRAPRQSFTYGFLMALVMAVVIWLAWTRGSHYIMLAMLGGFDGSNAVNAPIQHSSAISVVAMGSLF